MITLEAITYFSGFTFASTLAEQSNESVHLRHDGS